MKRIVSLLTEEIYDLAIIGGGIYGAYLAWDAALRGLTVALVDKGDFGNATSANSQKIIHGGLRYLQHANFKRMRESIRERRTLMRSAPHLVYPIPFLIPFYDGLIGGKGIMSLALKLNDLISFDRNWNMVSDKFIPGSHVISRAECLQLCPGLDQTGLSGGVIFYDGQVYNSERLILSVLQSATNAGADLANYIKVTGFIQKGNITTGFRAKDVITGNSLEVQAKIIVNCSGPWTDQVLDLLKTKRYRKRINWFKAVILVTRPLFQKMAVGVPCTQLYRDDDAVINKGYRYFFITPWRNTSLVGTFYTPYDGDPDDFKVTEKDIRDFINEVNAAYPAADIKRQDVYLVYGGLLPNDDRASKSGEIQYAKRYKIYDHEKDDGIPGLISVVGVKYTTARDVAEKTIDLVLKKLGIRAVRCRTEVTPVYGGEIEQYEDFMNLEIQNKPQGMSAEVIRHLISTYGSNYREILQYCENNPAWGQSALNTSPVLQGEIVHGIREEMAQRLGDVIFRRTELGTAGYPGDTCIATCAAIMATELGWDEEKTQREIAEVRATFSQMGCEQWTTMTKVNVS